MTQLIFNWCNKSYPQTMTLEQVESLYVAGKLTESEYEEVIDNVSSV